MSGGCPVAETKSKSKSPRKSRNRRLAMLAAGVALGLVCRVVPPQYQAPCAIFAKAVGFFMGVP